MRERTTVATCPACGIEVGDSGECPQCHLSASLFDAVLEAAGPSGAGDPVYLRTIGELLATIDPAPPAGPPVVSTRGLLSPPVRPLELVEASLATPTSARAGAPPEPILDLPVEPSIGASSAELKRRLEEYFHVGHRLGLDFTDFESRAKSAALVDDVDSLEVLAREMFVHLSSSIVEEYESLLARRNGLAQLLPTARADAEFGAIRKAIGVGDLAGAQRRLALVRDALDAVEEEWETGRILVAEGELMVATIREFGGDPSRAVGPLEQGRRLFREGRRADSERVLARAAVALWTLLQPLLLGELRRMRDRMLEERSAGLDIEPGLQELRAVAVELRKRNFVGTIGAYRRLRGAVERLAPTGVEGSPGRPLAAEVRTSPPV